MSNVVDIREAQAFPAKPEYKTDVQTLVRWFEQAEDLTSEARRLAERDRDYYDGKQLTEDEIAVLEKRGQPPVVYNRIMRKVNFLSGLEKQQRKDPKAFPRNPDDEAAANAATDGIRYVCDRQKWDIKRSATWRNLLNEGTGAVLVEIEETKDGPEPAIRRIAWDRFFYDPKSSELDFSDARFMGVVTWYDLDVAMEKGWSEEVLSATIAGASDRTYDDKPRFQQWADAKAKRVRVVEMYHKERGKWMRCLFTEKGFLEEPGPSPYLDEDGTPENAIVAASLYIDRDNNRYGEVRMLIDPQDEINKRRSKALWRSTSRQARVSPAAGISPAKASAELAKPNGIIVAERDDFEIIPGGDLLMAEIQLLQEAKAEIDALGANAALQGKNENDMSGRAILAQQQGGMVEVADPFDVLRHLTIGVYERVWNRIRQAWTKEKWVRVTDTDKNMRFVGLNQQVTVRMIAEGVMQQKPEDMQAAAKLVGPELLQRFMAGDPQAQTALGLFVQQHGDKVAETRNAVNDLYVDIVIDEGMDTPTVAAEQFDTLAKMLPTLAPIMADPAKASKVVEMLVEASALRNKDKLAEIIKGEGEGQQGPSPEEMMAQQQQALEQQAQQEAQVTLQKAQIDAQAKVEVAQIAAEADKEIALYKAKIDAQVADEKAQRDASLAERKAILDHEAKMRVEDATGETERKQGESDSADRQQATLEMLAQVVAQMAQPKVRRAIRDEQTGSIVGMVEEAA